jgi:hypothetical protein
VLSMSSWRLIAAIEVNFHVCQTRRGKEEKLFKEEEA